MRLWLASRSIVAIALVFAVGSGCGGGLGAGCGTVKPLPAGLAPFGVPSSQVIEGGVQARLTAPGMKKFSAIVEQLITSLLNTQLGCFFKQNALLDLSPFPEYLILCPNVQPACNMAACGAQVAFNSKNRPAPFNFDDGKDKADFSMADGTNPIMNVDLAFDLRLGIDVSYAFFPLIDPGTCTVEVYSEHWKGDATTKNLHIVAPIQLGVDATTGKLQLTTLPLQIQSLGIKIGTNGCPAGVETIGNVITSFLSFFDSAIGNLLINFATVILQPQIDQLVHNLLPDPLGLAGVLDTGTLLKGFDPPKEAGLETYLVPGGYVSSKDRGLTLGILAGMNSDRDPTTRTGTSSSEPSLCVPARKVPTLGAAPWNLPAQPLRNDFTLNAADQFAGSPDPVDAAGHLRDLLLGVSRTYFDLIGYHLYNSGSLCLHVDGATVPMLTTGALSLLVQSLGRIAEEPKAPLQLVLRPQQPVVFTFGAGTTGDALMHLALTDLRIDMYAWIEERWARVFTIALDLNLGLNLTVTKDASMNLVLQPVLSGLEAQNVTARVANTDLLAEPPDALKALIPSLINIAAGQLAGGVPAFPVPSIMGFQLDDLSLGRVQTTQDDFLALYATLKAPAMTAPLLDWSDPQHPRMAGEVRTLATIDRVDVPGVDALRALFDAKATAIPARPEVQLSLSADGANGRPLEFGWKVDGGIWRDWTSDAHPIVDDDLLLLQGRHTITVRARARGDYWSEDTHPVALDVLIDSVAPILKPHLDEQDATRLAFGGWDLVTDADRLEYAYADERGVLGSFGPKGSIDLGDAARLTNGGERPLTVAVRDEAGLIGTYPVDLRPYEGHGSWGKPTAAGCGCELGGAPRDPGAAGWLLGAGVVVLLLRARRRRLVRGLAGLAVVAAAATLLVGCGCDHNGGQCRVDDECSKLQCDAGKIPQCETNMCVCNNDLAHGDSGRYASMTIIDDRAYVAAYNETYGDLMIGSVVPPGRIDNWDFVDGVPAEAPGTLGSHVRGGISTPGDDVGRFTSIARTPRGEPIVAYYDATHGALKFASFGAIRWRSHVVDRGQGLPETKGDEIGTWASLTIDSAGRPGIAYSAVVNAGTVSGKSEGQLRWAQANTPDPQSAADWTISVVDTRALPDAPGDAGVSLLPDAIAVMVSAARRLDDRPAIAYYDRGKGNLRYAELVGTKWVTAILDGEAMDGTDTADVGQFPSLTFDTMDVGHIAYVDASHDNLLYVDTHGRTPVVVDDGYRPMDEMTTDGLPSPVFHLVGDSASIQLAQDHVVIGYQDSTTEELRLAVRDPMGKWTTQKVAGHDSPFSGAYGFWASARAGGRGAYVGSYAINQRLTPSQYYFEVFFVDLGLIQ